MITQEQYQEIINGQNLIVEGLNKLLALFTLEPLNEATNPILNLSEAAKLLGTSPGQLSEACSKKEVPHRRLGSKYLFSRVALTAWLHNVNMSYLFERMEEYKKYRGMYDKSPTAFLENWIRFTINPVSGANEEFRLSFKASDVPDILDTSEAAELIGVPPGKLREWACGFLYHGTPVVREGNKFRFEKNALIEWTKTPYFKKLKEDYLKNSAIYRDRRNAAEAAKEAERLAKEERKRLREEKRKLKESENK